MTSSARSRSCLASSTASPVSSLLCEHPPPCSGSAPRGVGQLCVKWGLPRRSCPLPAPASCETSVYTLYFPRSAIWADIRSHTDPVSMDKIPQPLERNVVCRAASVVARIMPELEQIPVAQLRKKLDSAGRLYRPCPSKQQPPLLAESLLLTGSLIHPQRSASKEDEIDSNGGSRGGTPLPQLVPAATAQSQFVENYQELQLQQESAARASLRACVHVWRGVVCCVLLPWWCVRGVGS